MPVHAFISTWGGVAVGPLLIWKSWKEIVLGSMVVLSILWLAHYPKRAQEVFKDRLIVYIMAFSIFSLIVTAFTSSYAQLSTQAGVLIGLRYLVMFCLAYIVGRYLLTTRSSWREQGVKWLAMLGIVLGLAGLLQVTVVPSDFLEQFGYEKNITISPTSTIDANDHMPRAFATMSGPNDYGAFLLIPLAVAFCGILSKRLAVVTASVSSMGLFLSGSRSAWIGALAMGAVIVYQKYAAHLSAKKLLAISAIFIGLVIIIFSLAVTVPVVRIAVFHSSPGDPTLLEGSTLDHFIASSDGIKRVFWQPLGCGLGCAGPGSFYGDHPQISESHFIQVAEEVGILGLILWLGMFVAVMVRLVKARSDALAQGLFISGVGLTVVGLILHVWADDAVGIVWWGLAGFVIGELVAKNDRMKYTADNSYENKTKEKPA